MEKTISSKRLSITVSDQGGEPHSILDLKTGKEILWNGDPVWWNRRAPVLFPLVGSLAEGYYMYDGKRYELTQHGFARDHQFSLIEETEEKLVFELTESEETLKVYPFQFSLQSSYSLADNVVTIARRVENRGTNDMPFCIGEHPAFLLPEGEDAFFEFSEPEQFSKRTKDGKDIEFNGTVLPYTRDMFEDGAYLFSSVKSDNILLRNESGTFRINFGFADFPYLALWIKPGAPFVCLEPWMTLGSREPSIEARPGSKILKPGESFSCKHTIEIG